MIYLENSQNPSPLVRNLRRAVYVIILLFGIYYAWHLRWVSEDAYISFRYARNLLEGHGLVFNPGERVEGYTNFLWTVLLTAGLAAKFTPLTISVTLGLLCSAVTLTGLFVLHRFLFEGKALVPVSICALVLNYTWTSFSTGGLETSLLAMWLTGIFLLLTLRTRSRETPKRDRLYLVSTGTVLALAVMTRPDAVLLFPCIIFAVLLERPLKRDTLSDILAVSVPVVLIYLPYFLWRFNYYGYFFPNTYYAKSANLANYAQGFTYLWEFINRYFLWAFLPWPLLTALGALRRRSFEPPVAAMAVFCLLYSAYVVRVGGDFMEGRLFVPVLPFMYLLIERALRKLAHNRLALCLALLALLVSTASDRRVIEPRRIKNGITDERSWAPVFALWHREGVVFGKHLPAGTVIATDAVGAFGYGSNLPIVDTLGLTDTTVAHQPLAGRSRPGHEKSASPEYLRLRSTALYRDGVNMYRFDRPPDFQMAGNRYFLVSEDPAVVAGFRLAVTELEEGRESLR